MYESEILEILKENFKEEYVINKKYKLHILPRKSKRSQKTLVEIIMEFGFEEAKKIFKDRCITESKKGTLQSYIDKYGEIDGPTKYKEKNSKLSVGYSSLKSKGLTDDEIIKIKEKHSTKSTTSSLKYLIETFGEIDGTLKYEEIVNKKIKASKRCLPYYLNQGLTIEQAKMEIAEFQRRGRSFYKSKGYSDDKIEDIIKRQTFGFSKDYYIDKYGEIDGAKIYKYNCSKSSDVMYYIEKYGEIDGIIKYESVCASRSKVWDNSNSKIQLEFSKLLYESCDSIIKSKFLGAPIGGGIPRIFLPINNEVGIKFRIPDILIGKLIIEFDGDYWHSKPDVYHRDVLKDKLAYEMGYKTLRISENEFKMNSEITIRKCLNFIEEWRSNYVS